MSKWFSTGIPGVRYRKHPSRRHGVGYDKYFAIHYRLDGRRRDEGVGWASQGWTSKKAGMELAALKRNQLLGEGPQSLKEARERSKQLRRQEKTERERQRRNQVTFNHFFRTVYMPMAEVSKRPSSIKSEKQYYQNWLKNGIGRKTFRQIAPIDLERLKMKMLKAGRAPRTVQLVFAIFRQVWNNAIRHGVIDKESPTKQVKVKLNDNRRLRFLTEDEADTLLDAIKKRSLQTYRVAELSLYTGMRFGEIAGLKWQNIDLDGELIHVVDSKGRNRSIPMNPTVQHLFEDLERQAPDKLVFPDRNGNVMGRVSNAFLYTINALGLNDGITDRRQRVVFHSLRHTHASWLVMNGVDLYTVAKILGHASIAMAERYSHLRPDHIKAAMNKLPGRKTEEDKPLLATVR